MLTRVFGPHEIQGWEIEKSAHCAGCHRTMYIPKKAALASREPDGAQVGRQCLSCGHYICKDCTERLNRGEFKCCHPKIPHGVVSVGYLVR